MIHTRVPESLEAELRKRAQDLGMSVSNLVRNVLGHAFGLVGDVVADSHAIARAARGDSDPAARPPRESVDRPAAERPRHREPEPTDTEDVLAWQQIVLAKNAVCSNCNDLLPRGSEAAIGVGTRVIVCSTCLEELRR